MTSTHPLHLQSLHNHHDANPGFWGRARIFQFFFLLVLRPTLGLPGFHLVQPGLEALAHPPQHAGEVRVVEGDHLLAVAPPAVPVKPLKREVLCSVFALSRGAVCSCRCSRCAVRAVRV